MRGAARPANRSSSVLRTLAPAAERLLLLQGAPARPWRPNDGRSPPALPGRATRVRSSATARPLRAGLAGPDRRSQQPSFPGRVAAQGTMSAADHGQTHIATCPGQKPYRFAPSTVRHAAATRSAAAEVDRCWRRPRRRCRRRRDAWSGATRWSRILQCSWFPGIRFLTLVSPGEQSKFLRSPSPWRIACQVTFPTVFISSTSGLSEAMQAVASAVATALQLPGVRGDPTANIAAQLQSRRLLLVLDSCEHLHDRRRGGLGGIALSGRSPGSDAWPPAAKRFAGRGRACLSAGST